MEDLKRYFSKDLGWGWGIQQEIVFAFLERAATASRGGVILDAGAGHQRYKPFFKDCIYIAQEHPEAGVANKQLRHYDILCDVRCIPLVENSVDCVLSTSSLEHMEYPEEFFIEAFRVLKPGGILSINVPFVYPEHEIPFDFQRPTRYGLSRWYAHAGFEDVAVHPSSSSIHGATAFLKTAILEDNGDFRKVMARSWVQGIKVAVVKNLFLKGLVYFFLVLPVVKLMTWLFEKPPGDETIFPIGWVATGRKPGLKGPMRAYSSKSEFLQENVLLTGDFCLVDGVVMLAAGCPKSMST